MSRSRRSRGDGGDPAAGMPARDTPEGLAVAADVVPGECRCEPDEMAVDEVVVVDLGSVVRPGEGPESRRRSMAVESRRALGWEVDVGRADGGCGERPPA
jgi:hypothetical protein